MLRHIHVEATYFSGADDPLQTAQDLVWMLEALTQRNMSYLKQRPNTPKLYESGVFWEAPKQFDGDCDEVKILRQALGSVANKRDVRKVLELIQDVLGGEHFCDIGVIRELGKIDCFPMDQKIIVRSKSTGQYELLSLGELRFVYPAYEALSYNFETKQQEFKDIIGWIEKGEQEVSRVRLSNGTDLIATDSHKFWTLNGSRQQHPFPDSFKVGQRTMGEYVDNYIALKNGKMSRNMYTTRSKILQAARIPALDVTHPTTAEAYLAGIYAAEGWRSGRCTGIAQHKGPVREKIEEALVGAGIRFSYDAGGRGKTPGSGAQYRLLGGPDNERIAFLRNLGINSFDKRFPQDYLSSDKDTVRHMLGAHGDGDGWRPRGDKQYKNPQVRGIATQYSTSSDMLMEQIRLGHLILGNPTYSYHQKNHQGVGNKPIWRIDEYNKHAPKIQGRASLTEKYLPDLTYATVRNAERIGKMVVGCIEVEGNHNFFLADGTLAANCDGLACWRAAELRQAGIPAKPYMTSRRRLDGGTTYHALVLWPPLGPTSPDWSSEDPSLLLGMSQPDRAADRQLEIIKNQERCDILSGKLPRFGAAGRTDPEFEAVLQEVLGLRRRGSR